MKLFLLLIPLLFYSVFSDAAVINNVSSLTPAQCASRPVLYGVGMHNYWNDSSGNTHAYYDGCEYIQKGVAFESPSTGYLGDWYPTGAVMPEPGQGSGSHPGNGSSDVDLSSMSSPVLTCQDDKPYNRSGNTTEGKGSVIYSGCLYSVKYDAKSDITNYNPLNKADINQKKLPSSHSYFDEFMPSGGETTRQFLNKQIKDIDSHINNINAYLNQFSSDSTQYYNDYKSAQQLIEVLKKYRSAVSIDIINSDKIGVTMPFDFTKDKEGVYYITSQGINFCGSHDDCFASLIDDVYYIKAYYYLSRRVGDELSDYISDHSKLHHLSVDYSFPYQPLFNYQSYDNLNSLLMYNPPSSYIRLGLIYSGRFTQYYHDNYPPYMDFNNQATGNPDTAHSGSGDSGNPDSGDSGSGHSGGGTVTPPDIGGGGGGGSGGTHLPDTGSQCVPGSPVWPDCDDQSGQTGGGDSSGHSGSGDDKPGSGDSGSGSHNPSTGGSGGGHGSGGDGHGGGDTDGDGDALLQEVKRFHSDVNAALYPDVSAFPQFDDTDADFSDVQKDIDKRSDEENSSWSDEASRMENVLGSITGSLPSTNLDMSGAVPPGITGVCRPWEFDIVIGITDGKQFKQHVAMTQFCTWYDTYIRPFVTWAFNFLTAVAVFNILYKGLRTLN
ncbi:hypothetical protein CE665_25490 [Salmonella enterica subsp. enterica serovar Poona]|nr:hypothetical protein [Salmonella enterica subsp. enterica serovar Poona]